jgi:hypothetical protein
MKGSYNKLTYEFISKYINNTGCKVLSKKYIGIDDKLDIKFLCGHIRSQSFYIFKNAKTHLCAKCAGGIGYNKDDILKIIEQKGYKYIGNFEKEYKTNESKISIEDTFGYKYYVSVSGIRASKKIRKNGKISSLFKFDVSNIYTIENIKKEIENNELNYILLNDNYIDAKNKSLNLKCLSCGTEWFTKWNNIQNGKGCPYCNISKGENKILKVLKNKNINFLKNYFFADCKDILNLTFDFYLPDINICIEYQGKQHYESIDFFGGYKSFEKQKIHDNIKKEYCKNNNIKLIEIPYWDYKNIEDILIKKLSLLILSRKEEN